MIHSPHPFNRGLTATDSDRIERIQKILFKILLKERYAGYGNACELFNNKILKARKKNSVKFAKKEYVKKSSIFQKVTSRGNTRQIERKYVQEFNCNTERYYKSSLPYLSRLLNQTHNSNK